jgi:hypothetical protein
MRDYRKEAKAYVVYAGRYSSNLPKRHISSTEKNAQ